MTPTAHDHTRVRLEEVLADIETLDDQLLAPLSLGPAIRNVEETIQVYERLEPGEIWNDAREGDR
ncbi:hypothetical protein [Natrinema halophilum]|uniref:Uncharacterized protein n=1 Tax=Natrinema halophilum TaxID=1699371 RepID=A0A7D5KZN3_9EURY|nr:hypothetical protein [Natrinema halophilum]QLG49660.1 hypothetical protein HYG82_12700 [Natrinema halophilum]